MNVVDLLITIVVVTILVTIVLAIVTYVAYKLRLARRPVGPDEGPDPLRYFVRYEPEPGGVPARPSTQVRTGPEGEHESQA